MRVQSITRAEFGEDRGGGILASGQIERFAGFYPGEAGTFAHALASHELLTLEALAGACERMNAANLLRHAARNRNGEGFTPAEPTDESIADTVRRIDSAGRYVMMSLVEQLPEYAALMHAAIGEIEPVIRARTGEPLRPRAFMFISSPDTLAPFHFDAEYNVLFQIAGRKIFTVYPPDPQWLSDASNEHYHVTGNNLLPWQEHFREQGRTFVLDPGDALFVPYRWPHWVEVGAEPSVSLSFTWSSKAGFEQDDAYRLNAWLRRLGLDPAAPRPLPARALMKSVAYRALARLSLV